MLSVICAKCQKAFMLNVVMLIVMALDIQQNNKENVALRILANCHHAECHLCKVSKSLYAECRNADCRGA
jgi:hypothetical protein